MCSVLDCSTACKMPLFIEERRILHAEYQKLFSAIQLVEERQRGPKFTNVVYSQPGPTPLLGISSSPFCGSPQCAFLSSEPPPPAAGPERQPRPLQLRVLAGSRPPGRQDLASVTETAVHDLDTSSAALLLAVSWHKANYPREEGSSLN